LYVVTFMCLYIYYCIFMSVIAEVFCDHPPLSPPGAFVDFNSTLNEVPYNYVVTYECGPGKAFRNLTTGEIYQTFTRTCQWNTQWGPNVPVSHAYKYGTVLPKIYHLNYMVLKMWMLFSECFKHINDIT